MYESWYLDKYDQYNDGFQKDFDVFGLKCQGSDTSLGKLERLDDENILDWIEDTEHEKVALRNGSLRLLLTRHKRYQHHEIKPWYMAFEKKNFHRICSAMKLPPDYLFLRKNAAGCGAYKKHTTFNERGETSHLSFTIRVPHSPRNNAKATWSMSVTWDASTGNTNALFEGVSDEDIKELQEYLHAKAKLFSHPIILPTMILELLNTFFIDHRRELERLLVVLEHQLGVTRGMFRQTDVWDWDYELHRESTKHCNVIYTGLVYLERRLEFTLGLSQFLLECLQTVEEEGLQQSSKILSVGVCKMVKETVVNNRNFARSQLYQTMCLQKRCQALSTVMYTVIAQQDSKINVKIARAAKRDSSSMTAIAVLGFTFLPAMLVASMFSMSMFDFSATSSSTFVNSKFWVYWAVTIPLTLAVLTIFKMWMSFQREMKGIEGESLKQERTMVVQSMHEANLALNTPFYPGKGLPGHIF